MENPYILPLLITGGPNPGNLQEQRAFWVSADTIAWAAAEDPANTYRLYYAPEGGLVATDSGITDGSYLALTVDPGGLPEDVQEKFPHLAALPALKIAEGDLALVPDILKGQIAVSALTPEGVSVDATGLQIPGVLDDLFTYDSELGVSWEEGGPAPGGRLTIRVWAPTAKSVTFHLY